jgi:heme exporter protein CcmD
MSILDLPHIGFVIAAYAISALVVAGLIGATAFDYWAQLRALAAYEVRETPSQGDEA